MANSVWSQTISFLSGFKTFFFYTLTFLIFGSAFLFLPGKFISLTFLVIDLNKLENVIQFLVFSYIFGLLLYLLSFLCFKIWYRLESKFVKREDTTSQINDVEILVYLQQNHLVADIHMLGVFHSLIVRLLFGLVLVFIFFTFGFYKWILVFVAILLFAIGLEADKSVNEFGDQIKNVINKKGQKC